MPTYQYACNDCGHDFEAVQSFSDDALTQCPECGGNLRKVFSAVGVVFKGSGFYRNDSRGKSSSVAPASAATSGDSGSSSTTGSGSGSGDSGSSSTPAPAAAPATSTPASTGSTGSST